jgi:Sec-independent protein translocase protein TatA
VGFGTNILFLLALGLLLLGPKRLPAILGHVARAKGRLETATRNWKSQLNAELETQHHQQPATADSKTASEP